MFYSQFILAKKGPLGTIWIAAHLERKLRKNQVTDTDIGVSVDSIIFPEVPIALRLSSHLMVGVVRIYSRKVNYLFHDCSEALLKIKQAFRSTAVDLPPEESTAPYHSITLPETFHLDDFELPEAAFQGDIDHHVSAKEQITLQDNPERTAYSTSEFGLDERFGDGNSSHMGLDLEEELLLTKDHSIQLESDDGIIIQGRSSIHLTDMDVDDNPSKDEGAEGCNNMDDEPSTHSKHITSWTGYNVQTPDLNMLLHNEDDAGPSTSYYQPSPYPFDEPASPEFVSAQAPATPGLMEETVPSRVHESPVLSPQRKASPSSNEETAKADNFAAPPSEFLQSEAAKADNLAAPPSEFLQSEAAKAANFAATPSEFLQSAAANANDAVGAETIDFGLAKPVQVESSGAVHEMDSPRQHCSTEDLLPVPQTSNLEATVDKLVRNTDDIAVSGETLTSKATMEGVTFVQNASEPFANGSTEPSMIRNPTHFNEGSVDVQGYNMPTMGGVPFVQNTSEPCTNGSAEPRVTGNPTHFNEGSVNMQGYNTMTSNYSIEQNSQRAPPEMARNNISVADFQQNDGPIFHQNTGPIFHQNAGPIFQQNPATMFQQNPATMFQQNSAGMFQQSPGTIFPPNAGTLFPQNAGTVFQQNTGTLFQQNTGTIFQQNAGQQNAGTIFQQNASQQNTGTIFQQNAGQQNAGTIFQQNSGQQNAGTIFQQNAGQQNAGTMFQQNAGTVFQQNAGTIPQYMAYSDRPNALSTSNFFPERETMLSAPDTQFHLTNDLGFGQVTAEKGITESDGSNKIASLTSRKRHLEDSLPAPESRTTVNLSITPHGKRPADAVPNDDDLLASILVGRRTPGLRLDSTPLPPNASSLKRQRLTPKTTTPRMTPKRRVKMDDAMVIHADIIRQQLISTEDIRRIRRKAPCTRSEIWMIEKGSLEEDIFREPIFSCMRKDLNKLQYRTYGIVPHPTLHNVELQGKPDMPETIAVDTDNVSISGAKESATLDHQLHMVLPDGTRLDAMPQEATAAVDPTPQEATGAVYPTPQEATDAVDGTAAFGLQMPSDDHVNNIEKVTDSLFGDGKETPLVNETSFDANIPAQDDILDKDGRQDTSADLQRNTNADTPLFVLDDTTHDSATRVTDAPDVVLDSSSPARAQAVDDLNGEQRDILHSDINVFEDKEMPTSEITGLEFAQNASAFPQPTEDENAVSAMGENSGLQENNAGSFVDMDNMGHDFALKECSDFGSAIHDVDTDFLNYDDDGDFDEAAIDDEPNPDEFQSLDALSGWSSRTRGVARYLKTLFDEDSGLGRKNVAIDHLLRGKTRKEASRMFFETLVLSTKDYIQVEQPNPFDFVNVKPGPKLLKTDF
ncbi:sister chromatid cohesion 1 protein 4 [Lolium rigidum]|uniref:sister chromatid cohesion 1 protein 4 n=1 Tax=Lolium rigidum TaxID=89674 RepID=UPI001F5D9517|nr:sister chromatid cohesion 1 protein 4 [Lolium rigidum]